MTVLHTWAAEVFGNLAVQGSPWLGLGAVAKPLLDHPPNSRRVPFLAACLDRMVHGKYMGFKKKKKKQQKTQLFGSPMYISCQSKFTRNLHTHNLPVLVNSVTFSEFYRVKPPLSLSSLRIFSSPRILAE